MLVLVKTTDKSMNHKKQQILKWQQQGLIKNEDVDQALAISDANNSPKQWLDFISKSLLWLSILSVAFGTIFFFAYNWNEISTFQKFALVQGLMIVSVFFYTQTKNQSTTSTAILFLLALLIGSLFALFGQTYQTGKDPWQLFMLWALFVTPLALTSRSSSLWLLWLGLANLTLMLLLDARYGLFGMLFQNERSMLFYAFLNTIAAASFEYFYRSKYKLINNRIAAQSAIVVSMMAFTWVGLYSVFESVTRGFDVLFYITWMASIYYMYRLKTVDVLILASWVVSGIIFILGLIGRVIDNDLDGGAFLLFGLLIIGLSTVGIKWLMTLLKEGNVEGEKL